MNAERNSLILVTGAVLLLTYIVLEGGGYAPDVAPFLLFLSGTTVLLGAAPHYLDRGVLHRLRRFAGASPRAARNRFLALSLVVAALGILMAVALGELDYRPFGVSYGLAAKAVLG